MNPQTPPVIPSQTPTDTKGSQKRKRLLGSQKRKKLLDCDIIIEALDVKPKDYETAWNNLRALVMETSIPGHVERLAPTSLEDIDAALELFNLREMKTDLFADIQGLPMPQYLMENIARIYAVTNGGCHKNNEAFSRTILDQIIISSMYEESEQRPKQRKDESSGRISHAHPSTSDTSTQEEPARLELLHEMPLSKHVTHEGETKLLTGYADYSVWYDSAKKKTCATNLLIIEAKRRYHADAALPQLAAYMGIVHTTRKESKQNSVVYGASSDGIDFRFCRIDNDGIFVKSRLLEWHKDKDQIYSIMRSLLRAAALSSPSTTPIKDPMQRKMIISSFGSPQNSQKFDYGISKLKIYYEDEIDEEEVEIIDIRRPIHDVYG